MTLLAVLVAITGCSTDAIPTAPSGPQQNRLVADVRVQPSDAVIAPDEGMRLEARVFSARGQPVNGRPVEWSSSDESVAVIDANGNVVAINEGSATITANVLGVLGKATIDVRGEVIDIELESSGSVVQAGAQEQLSAIYVYKNGARRPAGKLKWESGDLDVAVIDAEGMLTGRTAGSTEVIAAGRGRKGKKWLTIDDVPVTSVTITPSSPAIRIGESVKLEADAWDADGNRLYREVTWSSTDEAIARVNTNGVVRGNADGTAVVTATAEGVSGSVEVVVGTGGSGGSGSGDGGSTDPVPPGAVTNLAVVFSGENSVTLRFTEVDDGTGSPANYNIRYVEGSLGWGWSQALDVTSGSCATPLIGQSIGGTITCTVEGLQASTDYDFQLVAYRGTLNVDAVFGPLSNIINGTTQDPALVVTVVPSAFEMVVGAERQLDATVTDSYGNEVSEPVTWTSTRSSVASVSNSGRVTGNSSGDALILASAQEASDNSDATVTQSSSGGGGDGGSGGWGGSGGDHPNEPAGFTIIANNPYTQDMYTDVNGQTWNSFQTNNKADLLTNQSDAPISPPSAVRFNWDQGQSASANGQGHQLSIATSNNGEMYTHVVFMISSTWVANTNSNTHKFVAWNGGVLGGALRPFMTVLSGQTPGQARIYFAFQDSHTSDSDVRQNPINMDPNITNPTVTHSVWWHLEVYSRLNQTTGSGGCDNSGIVRAWLYKDGESPVLISDADNSKGDWGSRPPGKILGCDDSPSWNQFRYSGLWGGKGGSAPDDIWIDFDHYYGSVK
jgi:hypothetical protein